MEIKKTPNADIEKEKTIFFLFGLIFALATLFVVLEWSTHEDNDTNLASLPDVFIEEEFSVLLEQPEAPNLNNFESIEESPQVIYEDFNVVEEPVNNEIIENIHENIETSSKDIEIIRDTIKEELQEEIIYTNPEVMPQYTGGYGELVRFIFNNLKYPPSAKTQRKEGRVWCSFIVNKDGSISDIKIEKGVYVSLDQEALRVLKLMQAWQPGKVAGQEVRVKVYLPIVFKL